MSTIPETAFRAALTRAVESAWDCTPASIPLTYPPKTELGDLASPLCFELARSLKRSPRDIAVAIARAFEPGDGIERVEVAGPGYLNAFLDRDAFLTAELLGTDAAADSGEAYKRFIALASCFKNWSNLAARFGLTPKDREKLTLDPPE